MILFVEGKRTEGLSPSTEWFPNRNQLWRNLDILSTVAAATGKRYGLLLLAEECRPVADFDESLPHLAPYERDFLRPHYLGCLTWRQACKATGVIDYEDLPKTIDDAEP